VPESEVIKSEQEGGLEEDPDAEMEREIREFDLQGKEEWRIFDAMRGRNMDDPLVAAQLLKDVMAIVDEETMGQMNEEQIRVSAKGRISDLVKHLKCFE
jgi:hypothetical protein